MYWLHTLFNFGRIIFKSKNFRRNKNFHSSRTGTIHTWIGKDDQKIERVIHETAETKPSVWCAQEVRRLNDSVIITNKQNNFKRKDKLYWWSHHVAKRQHGVGIAIKVDKGIEIQEIILVSARIVVSNAVIWVLPTSYLLLCTYWRGFWFIKKHFLQ